MSSEDRAIHDTTMLGRIFREIQQQGRQNNANFAAMSTLMKIQFCEIQHHFEDVMSAIACQSQQLGPSLVLPVPDVPGVCFFLVVVIRSSFVELFFMSRICGNG